MSLGPAQLLAGLRRRTLVFENRKTFYFIRKANSTLLMLAYFFPPFV